LQTTLEASMLVIVDGDTENQENEDDDLWTSRNVTKRHETPQNVTSNITSFAAT
jgi:hypothetical protein